MLVNGLASSASIRSYGEEEERLQELSEELESLDEQIKRLQDTRRSLLHEQRKIHDSLQRGDGRSVFCGSAASDARSSATTNYFTKVFEWTSQLLPRAKEVWKIREFRSVQQAVCNAALDDRDVVCVMPTGGGKSLCYQLPALFSKGLTLVVSPLISLSMDQMWHLREAGVACEMLYSAASREEQNDILQRVRTGIPGKEIKVLFVTPERVAKSKVLLAALQKCYERGHLARIVIDEAHCCSQMGHDFRPDYKNLSILRKLYTDVPFLCLSATLSPFVLEDVRKILGLSAVVDPEAAPRQGTVYFTAPLHRPNLHYQVINRSSAVKEANQDIADYILTNHSGKSGIVYTFSKADTQKMADALNELSTGKIRAAVYHADLEDDQKTRVHHKWRQGKIDVVVATIAFGMGIDKGDVRFVLHASLGKSLDSYYQETGRAGRDGRQADCVLFYRPADASRVSGMLAGDPKGQEKLHSMLAYAQSAKCRKSLFADYFVDQYGGNAVCQACDNCLLPVAPTDVTTEAWKVMKVMEEIYAESGRITLAALGDLCRGLGGGQYSVVDTQQKKRKRQKVKASQSGFLDLKDVIGDKVGLSKDDTERVLIELLLKGYLEDEHNATAYAVNVYVRPGKMAGRLTRFALPEVENKVKGCPSVFVKLLSMSTKKKRVERKSKKAERTDVSKESGNDSEDDNTPLSIVKGAKRKVQASPWKENFKDDVFEDDLVHSDRLEERDVHQRYQDFHASSSGTSNRYDPIEIDDSD